MIILKIDYVFPDLYIPIVEYKVFNPETKELLDLNICKENPISLSYPILKDINDPLMYNPNNKFYNDKCYPFKS